MTSFKKVKKQQLPSHPLIAHLQEVKKANVPKGTLAHKSWHVERRRVMTKVLEALT